MVNETIATYRATKAQNGAVKVFLDSSKKGTEGLQKIVREIILQDKTLNAQEQYEIEGTVSIKYDSPYGEAQ